jgi:2-dehydro-3-deoxyglucarate aldolase/4-hydroxy-2-oxoheptanedioate aldolase
VGTFVNLGSPLAAEMMALAGFDWIVIDLEHGAGDEFVALAQLQAVARTGVTPLVRVESLERPRFGRVLDHGAAGIVAPRLEGVEDARRCAAYCRYGGMRGVARYNRSWHWGARAGALADADAAVVCAVQIETASALEAADEIAAVEDVDVLFVGPADLGHSLGIRGGPDTPELLDQVAHVARAARAHGKAAGMLVGTLDQVARYRDLGFTFLGCSSDSSLLMERARQVAGGLHDLKEVRSE